MVKNSAVILLFFAWCTVALSEPPLPITNTTTSTTTSTTTTTTTTLKPPALTTLTTAAPTVTISVDLKPKNTNGLVKIYKIINNFYHYLQPDFDNTLGLHKAHSTSMDSPVTNLLKYELNNYDQNGSDKNDVFVVLRYETLLKYICLNHCGDFYNSATLNHDCVFVFENVDNDHDSDDKSFVLAKFMGTSETKTYIMFDNNYYTLNKTKDESRMVLFERRLSSSSVAPLTELLDEVNDDDCIIKIDIQPSSTDKVVVDKKSGSIIADVDKSVLTLSSIIIACVTVVILIIGALLIVFVVLHFKNKKVN